MSFSIGRAGRPALPVQKAIVRLAGLLLLGAALAASPAGAEDHGLESLRQTGKAFAAVARKVSPAVVFIQVEKTQRGETPQLFPPFGDDEFFRRFFGTPLPREPRRFRSTPPRQRIVGQGSGFIVSPEGYILTNNHVVGGADRVTVKLEDDREFTARIIGTDPHSDVAVIKIDAKNLPTLLLGDSDDLEVGEWVVAIGNPFGLSHTLTAGVVSAKGRSSVGVTDYENFIQTDAAINPGNSGGPLVNLEGQAVGMNTAIFSRSGGYMGIGFAIPINMARAIKDQLIENGAVIRGYLGIVIQDLTPDLAASFGIVKHKGVLIAQVSEDSPAEEAGLRRGDVIIEFGGQPVEKVGPFRNRVALERPGKKVGIAVLREGKRRTFTVTIGRLPEKQPTSSESTRGPGDLGLAVRALTPDLARRFGLEAEEGVVVTGIEPGSPAARASIKVGAVIREVNHEPVTSAEAFRRAVEATPNRGVVLLLVEEGGHSRYVALKKR